MSSEWVEWHERYEHDPGLVRRLEVVQAHIRRSLDACPPGPIRVISLCAGDGRDLLGVLETHPRRADVSARLAELDPQLVERGRARAQAASLGGVEFALCDAGTSSAYAGAVPADVVLVCGVFGNISDADVRRTVESLPELCAQGASVVWTRGIFEPDLTPAIRGWFADLGFSETAFIAIPGTTSAVGSQRLAASPRAYRPGVRLFTFLPKAERPSQR